MHLTVYKMYTQVNLSRNQTEPKPGQQNIQDPKARRCTNNIKHPPPVYLAPIGRTDLVEGGARLFRKRSHCYTSAEVTLT